MGDYLDKTSTKIMCELLRINRRRLYSLVLRNTFFVHPELAFETRGIVKKGRSSHTYFKGIKNGEFAMFNGERVKITGNRSARDLLGRVIGRNLKSGNDRQIGYGWDAAHIWGKVHDPSCYAAGWNICMMPNFFRVLTEKQNKEPYFELLMQQVSYDLYFKGMNITPDGIVDHGIDVSRYIKLEHINLMEKYSQKNKSKK